MNDFLLILRWIVRVLTLIVTVSYLYQLVYLFLPVILKPQPHKPTRLHRYAVLIAARNEEAVLPHLLDSIRNQDYPADLINVFVIADNCTDQTARVAAEGGARVYTRFNKTQIGKGYALNYLLGLMETSGQLQQYDAFLIFDADNLLEPDYIRSMNRICSDGYEAFCGYRNTKNFANSWLSSGCGLWYLHESTHLNRSRMLIGSCCAVSGTGFGFTRQLLERLGGWNFFTLTEDVEFSVWCATQGVRIGYCHDAVLYDEQTSSFPQSWRQRTRWVQGGMQVSVHYARDLLRGFFKGGHTAYASFETATLTMWGYGTAAISCALSLLLTLLELHWLGLFQTIALTLAGTYLSMFLIGVLTLALEWNRIRATTTQKLQSLLTFPLFMMTFIPVALAAPFQKFQWLPIHHTVAVSASSMGKK